MGPEPTAPTDPEKKAAHLEKLAEGLRYLCGMCQDPNLKATIALNANGKGTVGYAYLVEEFLQGRPVQSRYLAMLHGMALNRSESVVLFRNKWQKVVSQLSPKPDDTILCEMFANAVTMKTGSFYDTCLDQKLPRDNFKVYTQTLTQLCQERKDRLDRKARGEGEGVAGGDSTQAMKAMIAKEIRQALKGQDQDPSCQQSGRDKKGTSGHSASRRQKPPSKGRSEDPCVRCGKRGHKRKDCKEPRRPCTFRFPDGEVCGGDHAEQFCWGKHPELCKLPRVKKAILRRLGKTANQASIEEEDSEDDEESGAWGDACGHCIKVIHPCDEPKAVPTPENTEAHDCSAIIQYPALSDATESIVDITCLKSGCANEMFVDSGASDHIIVDSRCVVRPDLHRPSGIRIKTGNSVSQITSIGPVSFNVKSDSGEVYTITRRALYANEKETGFNVNLWSVPLDYEMHGTITIFDPANNIKFADGTVVPFKRDGQRRYILNYSPVNEVLPRSYHANDFSTNRDGTPTVATQVMHLRVAAAIAASRSTCR